MYRYAKLIWKYVARYALLDLLIAAFFVAVLYLITRLACAIAGVSDHLEGYATQSIKLLGIIYIVSILATSCHDHIRLLRLFVKSETERIGSARDAENNVGSTKTGESET